MADNKRYGTGAGPYVPIAPDKVTMKLIVTGINVADGPKDLQDTEATDMNNVRIEKSGVGPDFALRRLPLVDTVVE